MLMASGQRPTALEPTSMANIVRAPQPYTRQDNRRSVFLAGSISIMPGLGTTWQTSLANSLSDLPITILDPLRPDWDASWVQDISFAPFREQVNWELDMQEAADVIAMYLGPEAQAPISLLELGLFARSGKVVCVACPDGFWKKGNVEIVCNRFGIDFVDNMDALEQAVRRRIGELDSNQRHVGR